MLTKLVLLTIVAYVAGAYCPGSNSGNQQSQDSTLGTVQMGGMEQKGGCPGGTGIQWFPKSIANVNPGSSQSMTIQVITCGTGYERKAAAWIDYNGNQRFEAWEKLGETDVGPEKKNVGVTWKFTFPTRTSAKVTNDKAMYLSPDGKPNSRMRVVVIENGSDPMDPCLQFPYGALKDFPVVISPAAALDTGDDILITLGVLSFVGFFVAMAVFMYIKKVAPKDFLQEIVFVPVVYFCGLVKAGVLFTAFKCKCTKKGETGDYNEL